MDEVLAGELKYYAWTLSPSIKELLLVPISDAHYGNPLYSEKHFARQIKTIQETRNMYAVLNGDLCESIIRSSKGDVFTQKITPQKQRDDIVKKLKPIRHKILGMTTGNHENRIYRETGIDISKDIAKGLKIPYRPEGMLVKISFGDNNNYTTDRPYTYFIYFTHGYGGARTKPAKAIKVERAGTWIDADCYIMSHDHVVNVAPDIYLKPDPRTHKETDDNGLEWDVGKITAYRKMLVKSNAYLKWGGYAEMLGFPPTDLETPIIKFKGTGVPKVKVEV